MNTIRKYIGHKYFGLILFLTIFLILVFVPLYAASFTVILITQIVFYTVLTVSWALFSGYTGYVSLAVAAFIGVGIYTAAFTSRFLPLPVVVLIGGLFSSALAALIGSITLRLRGIYFAIFTFGLTALMYQFIRWYEITITHKLYRQVTVVDGTTRFYYMLGIFSVLMITSYLIGRSRWGLALKSIGQDEEAASHTGINVTALKIITFSISSFFLGAAGVILATKLISINPDIAFVINYSFFPIFMAIFGGLGNLYGPVLGSAIFGYLEERFLVEFPRYFMLAFGLVLIVAIVFMPNGLMGLIQKWIRGGRQGTDAATRG